MKNHTTGLGRSKKLEKAGWKKVTLSVFAFMPDCNYRIILNIDGREKNSDYPAPLATELYEELPAKINGSDLVFMKSENGFCGGYINPKDGKEDEFYLEDIKSLPNALAECWIYLKTNKLI